MIQYALKCDKDHRFDSWFASASAFDKLHTAGMVTCAVCGSASVKKELMAPSVRPSRTATGSSDVPEVETSQQPQPGLLSAPATPAEQMIAELRRNVEDNSDYVGKDFVKQAREMHTGDAPERSIYGEAKLDEARELLEDGIPVLPLPFRPSGKDN